MVLGVWGVVVVEVGAGQAACLPAVVFLLATATGGLAWGGERLPNLRLQVRTTSFFFVQNCSVCDFFSCMLSCCHVTVDYSNVI